jgi:methylthioribose-1-phosphate isomerase
VKRALEPQDIVRYEEDGPKVVLLDQRRLPDEEVELECRTVDELVTAIRELAVRGAPAIGVAAAYGLALAAARGEDIDAAAAALAASRPTAVNLSWARAGCTRTRSSGAGRWPRTPLTCSAPARAH